MKKKKKIWIKKLKENFREPHTCEEERGEKGSTYEHVDHAIVAFPSEGIEWFRDDKIFVITQGGHCEDAAACEECQCECVEVTQPGCHHDVTAEGPN